MPSAKKSKKFKQPTPAREPIECLHPTMLPSGQQVDGLGQEGMLHSPLGHLVTPEVLALAESPVLVKSKKKKKKKDKQGQENKTEKTKAKTKMKKKKKDLEALCESAISPGVKATEGLTASVKKSGKRGSKHAAKASDEPEPASDTVYNRTSFTIVFLVQFLG
ncbi:unnamed protein product [Dibothriocephalus latus]|uniref:Uncharacterized protein n=1 Tax=Dibothriocephalus latus TaxID=60516 RepID=A0A3P6R6N5_DIBLA|nr:unnamed protein product [Dibothriocephalus latus]